MKTPEYSLTSIVMSVYYLFIGQGMSMNLVTVQGSTLFAQNGQFYHKE